LFFQGYYTIFFWIMIAGCVAYLLVRTLGLKWYMKREFDKQVAETEIPEQLRQLKLGVQSHGLIMNLPAPNTAIPIQMRGMTMKAAPSQQAVIPWSAVTSWDETDEYVFIMFTLQGQQGSQIIPKRIKELPITTITKHLGETMPKGLRMDTLQTS
ncbi:MAG: YcxB family protein, partial [Moraxella sp.]|nr:YcxB family protein [Moraxella sp.]